MSTPTALIEPIAYLFGIDPSQLRPTAGGNFKLTYEYSLGGKTCILKVIPPNPDIDLAGLQAVQAWLDFLAAQGGPVPPPVVSRNGRLIEVVRFAGQDYLAFASEKAPGILAENLPPDQWEDDLIQALGQAVGQCHRLAQIYVPASPQLRRPDWDRGENCFNPKEALTGADPDLLEKRAQVLARIQPLPKDPGSWGLAHLDMHMANFFIEPSSRRIVLFDFDDCGCGWYIMDLAMLLFDALVFCAEPERKPFGERYLVNLLRGYRARMPVSRVWVGRLPDFLKLLEINLYLMVYRDGEPAEAGTWAARFLHGRRQRIDGGLPYVDLDFEGLSAEAEA